MQFIKRWTITIALLIAALSCYFLGAPSGGLAFLILGGAFELLFWFRIFKKKS